MLANRVIEQEYLKALQFSLVQERKALYDNYLKEVNLAK